MEYNVNQHIKLLKYEQALKNEKKSLKAEDSLKYSELQKFRMIVIDYVHWCQKKKNFELLIDFLDGTISEEQFSNQFSELIMKIDADSKGVVKNFDKLKNLNIDPVSCEFSNWMSEIYLCCKEFYPDFIEEEDRAEMPFAKTATQLKEAILKLFPKIEKYFNN